MITRRTIFSLFAGVPLLRLLPKAIAKEVAEPVAPSRYASVCIDCKADANVKLRIDLVHDAGKSVVWVSPTDTGNVPVRNDIYVPVPLEAKVKSISIASVSKEPFTHYGVWIDRAALAGTAKHRAIEACRSVNIL